MTYLGELRINWRFIAAATIGLGCGHVLNMYLASIFGPHLLQAFGWSKAQFALIGTTIVAGVIVLPIAGRLIDTLGVRRMATVGIIISPLCYVALSFQNGDFSQFLLITLAQAILVGSTTTSMVYSRLIAEQFVTARGIALSIAACAPAISTAIAAPLLSRYIDGHGWRAGYLAVAVMIALMGALTLLLIPRRPPEEEKRVRAVGRSVRQDYPEIFRNRSFQRIAIGSILCHLTLAVQASQLNLALQDRGLDGSSAAMLLSLYAMGIVGGRLACGLALDRFPAHIVAAIAQGVPAIGFLIFGSGVEAPMMLAFAMLLVGVSTGADFDVTAYLVMRFFQVKIFSTVYSLNGAAIAVSAAGGSLLLSAIFKEGGGFSLFFLIATATTIVGSLAFLGLGKHPPVVPETEAVPG